VALSEPGAPAPVSFAQALRWWLRLGFISFGGPAGQIAIMHDELVTRRRWISERRFLHALNYCMVLPGPEAQQLATYIGWLMHGVKGGLAAGALFVLPSLLVLIALSWIYVAFGSVPAIAGALYGIKPAVTAIVVHAAWRIGRRALHGPVLWSFAAAAFVAVALFHAPFPLVIVAAGVAGWIGARLAPAQFAPSTSPAAAAAALPALIDDATRPPHTLFVARRFVGHAALGMALWLATFGALYVALGGAHLLVQMAGFFTGAALLTFGGAYAVLPYVVQAAVLDYGWLSTSQMIDGLALGESTPGPLIMIVAFVGFVGGWQHPFAGDAALAGIAAATVATFFTFLPSFLFILLGGPLVESTHGDVKLTAPLTGITAAVVGVILNLAVFFAAHVLWPQGLAGEPEWAAAVIGLGALVALFRYDAGILRTLAASAALGLAWSLLR
jgi:chromate transporter